MAQRAIEVILMDHLASIGGLEVAAALLCRPAPAVGYRITGGSEAHIGRGRSAIPHAVALAREGATPQP
ncbi:MAG: hypothetical protein QN187_16450 [Armatimonadota bacterium]|nr:hypothetical protein [Armatimonadota bacterium]MDR7518249.1 hypothetical protein [Armatimonadota bacterium]MDR7548673.1 hypothetical protein [Armatimonadota bacterium]